MTNPIPARVEYAERTDVSDHTAEQPHYHISDNTLMNAVLNEAIAEPLIARQRARQAQAAALSVHWQEVRAAMCDQLYRLADSAALHMPPADGLGGSEFGQGLRILALDAMVAITKCGRTVEIEALFATESDTSGAGPFSYLNKWARPHIMRLFWDA